MKESTNTQNSKREDKKRDSEGRKFYERRLTRPCPWTVFYGSLYNEIVGESGLLSLFPLPPLPAKSSSNSLRVYEYVNSLNEFQTCMVTNITLTPNRPEPGRGDVGGVPG